MWKSEREDEGPRGIGHGKKAVVLEVDPQFWPHPLVPHGAQPGHLLTIFFMVLQQYATWQLKKKKEKATASVIGFGAEQKLEAERSLRRLLRGAEKITQELLSESEEMLTCIIQCWKV